MKKIEGSPKNLKQLLQNTKYSIHYYQREYMWQRKHIEELISSITSLKNSLKNIEFYGDDVTKILIKRNGLSGFELSKKLFEKFSIEDEKTNEVSTMLLTGLGTSKEKLLKLQYALQKLDKAI